MKTAVFGFRTPNIGDDVQSIGCALHLGRVDRLIDRDAMAEESLDEPHAVICNSWFMLGNDFRLPPNAIRPLFHGFCLGEDRLLETAWPAYLKAHEPIGCRDLMTVDKLRALGIEAYWSGCLSLFIGDFLTPVPPEERKGVLFIDIKPRIEKEFLPADLRAEARRMSTFTPLKARRIARLFVVARLLDRIRRARLVVTRRLHVALPAAGFGVPVVALPDPEISDARRRFSGFMDFLPGAFIDEPDKIRALDWANVASAVIPNSLKEARRLLIERLAATGLAPHPGNLSNLTGGLLRTRPHDLGVKTGSAELILGNDREPVDVLEWNDRSVSLGVPDIAGKLFQFQAALTNPRGETQQVGLRGRA